MHKYHLITPILFSLAASAGLAAEIDLTKLPPPADKKGLTYAKDVKPMFESSCLRCHGGERPKAGLHLDTLEGVLQGSKDGKVITPGASQKSQLIIAVARLDPESAMPPMKGPGQFGRPGGPDGGRPGSPPPGGQRPPGAPGNAGGQGHGPGGPGGQGPGGFGPPPKPLTPEQVGLLRAWVDQGAK